MMSGRTNETRTLRDSHGAAALLFCGPAFVLLMFTLVIPFFVAFGITLTDKRLLSPNDAEFVGLQNFSRLLAVDVVERRPAAALSPPSTDATDDIRYERLRSQLARQTGSHDYKRLAEFNWSGKRYAVIATDPVFWKSLRNTFLFVAMVIPLQCGVALLLALLVNSQIRGRTLFRAIYFSPVVTSMVVVSIVWSFLYNQNHGLINETLSRLAGHEVAIDWLGSGAFALPAVVIMSAWQGAGLQMLIFLAGLQSIDRELYEAATIDGANSIQRFLHVTLPGLRNTIVFVMIATTVAAFGLFVQIDVMTGGGPNDATSTLIFHAVRMGFREQDVAYGSTVAVVFFVLVLAVSFIQRALTDSESS